MLLGDISIRRLTTTTINESNPDMGDNSTGANDSYHHVTNQSVHPLNMIVGVKSVPNAHALSRLGSNRDRILQIIRDFEAYPSDLIWQSVDVISTKEPFIFFHQRTAGGSSIRKSLLDASLSSNLSHFIICYSPAKLCDQYHFPKQPPYAVYAGHFQWNYLMDLNRLHHSTLKFSCMTNFRDPVR